MGKAHKNKPRYRELISRVREVVCRTLPVDATVIVMSKGDEQLLNLNGRKAWHFPQAADGRYAGYYPADSADAISQLVALQAEGGEFLVVPSTAYWWFTHYAGFKQYLKTRCPLVVSNVDTCLVFALCESKVLNMTCVDGAAIDEAIEDAEAIARLPIETHQLESAGQVEKACQILRAWLVRIPDSFCFLDEYIRLSRSTDDLRYTHKILLKATELRPESAGVHFLLAEMSLALGDCEQAINAVEHAIKLSADHIEAWKLLSAIHGLQQTPAETHDLVDLVKREYLNGNLVLAKCYLIEAIALLPDDYDLNLELAELEFREGRLHTAERHLTRLVALRPTETMPVNKLFKVLCRMIEENQHSLPGQPVDPTLLDRFLAELQMPGRAELLSAETHLSVAEALATVNQVDLALTSLALACRQINFSSEVLRNFAGRLVQLERDQDVSFIDSCALPSFFRQLGQACAAKRDVYKALAFYQLATVAEKESAALSGLWSSLESSAPSHTNLDGFHLITCLYNESHTSRILELLTCLHHNFHNAEIAAIHVFFDDSRDISPKLLLGYLKRLPVRLNMIRSRPTLGQLFKYANERLPNQKIIVANSDIYFDDSLKHLKGLPLTNTIIPLTRWNINEDGSTALLKLPGDWPNYISADSWIFQTPLKIDFYCEYPLGTMFCDSFLNKQLFEAGLFVINPCLDIKSYHLQAGESLSQNFQREDKEQEKQKIWCAEFERNGRQDPISGVVWSRLDYSVERHASQVCDWKPFNIVLSQTLAARVNTRFLKKLAKIAETFDRNLWITDDRLDSLTHTFIEHVSNANVNLLKDYHISKETIKKSRDRNLNEILSVHCEQDVFIDSAALNETDLACEEHVKPLTLKHQPKISVITPKVHSAKFFERAVESVLAQEYKNFEHIVIGEVDADSELNWLTKYQHLQWLSAHIQERNAVISRGVALASGDIIVCLYPDDYFLPGAFVNVIHSFEMGCEVVMGRVNVIMDDGSVRIDNPRTTHREILRHAQRRSFVNHCGLFYLREVYEMINGFNPDRRLGMDSQFLIECSKRFIITRVNAILGVCGKFEETKAEADFCEGYDGRRVNVS